MNDYIILPGRKATPITPALRQLAAKSGMPLADLVHAKKSGGYTDYGITIAVGKAIRLGLSVHSIIDIQQERRSIGHYPRTPDRFTQSQRQYHGYCE